MLKNTPLKNYRCPVSRCSGWVVLVAEPEERSFWGCGECGSVWYNRSKLFEEIRKIINRFPYRQRCYVFDGDTILPNKLADESKNYEELVRREPFESATSYIRG